MDELSIKFEFIIKILLSFWAGTYLTPPNSKSKWAKQNPGEGEGTHTCFALTLVQSHVHLEL